MRLQENKCKILCFKKKSLFTIKKETVNISSHQKDLGKQICDNLTWHQNASSRASKTLKALWYLRRILHHRTLPQVKLNALYQLYPTPVKCGIRLNAIYYSSKESEQKQRNG